MSRLSLFTAAFSQAFRPNPRACWSRYFSVQLWDCLVLLLVIFPLATGGEWIKRPHLYLEWTDVGLAAALLMILAAVLKWPFRQPMESSWILKKGEQTWLGWKAAMACEPRVGLFLCFLMTGTIWATTSWLKHMSLGSHAFDLGIFTNALWNLSHGFGFYSSVKDGILLFADHQSPLFWLFAPIFSIFSDARTLLLLQAYGLAAGVIPLYFLGRQYLGARHWGLAALPLLYACWLPLRNANAFDFHPEVFMLPLFLAAIAGLQSSKKVSRILGAFAFFLALGAKESSGAVACGIGLAWLLGAGPMVTRIFTRRLGALAMILGAGVFVFDVKIVPKLLGVEYAYNGLYDQFGGGLLKVILSPIENPILFLKQVSGPARLKFLFWTLAPLGFLPLWNWRVLVAALPGYLMLFLSAGDQRVNLNYHYAIEPGVALFWSLPGALAALSARLSQKSQITSRYRYLPLAVILFFALGTFGRSEVYRLRKNLPNSHARWVTSKFLRCVDPNVTVAASESLVAHLATRHWVHSLDSIQLPDRSSVACVIQDVTEGVGNWPMTDAKFMSLQGQLRRQGFVDQYHCGALSVLSKTGNLCMVCTPEC